MGSAFSEDAPTQAFPTTGKAISVRIQCSHDGKCIAFSEYKGYPVTSDWTTAHLQEAIEVLAGVHRGCQRLMFSGRLMEAGAKVISLYGSNAKSVPDRIRIFLIVDRYRFPQILGPFNHTFVPLEGTMFEMPEMNAEVRRSGFYWDMDANALEGHGLFARTRRITGQASPAHPFTADSPLRKALAPPKNATEFVWSYPVAGWESVESDAYALERWEAGLDGGAAVKSFFSVGGFLYLDGEGKVAGATTLSRPQGGDVGTVHFAEPRKWLPEWTAALVEQGRFQKITWRALKEVGARMYLWLRPHEVIEAADGNPLPFQPEVPYGGFVYLFHDNLLSTDEVEVALDRYFAVVPTPTTALEGQLDVTFPSGAAFRALTLVDGDRIPGAIGAASAYAESFLQDDDDGEELASSFMMSTPASGTMGTPSTATAGAAVSPGWARLDLRSPQTAATFGTFGSPATARPSEP
eukprot:CAMPEP_0170270042 /NCGR_PEP_ID=MMETSP0116_2-20130129/34965_1 /TAXON_ID=400756 /ORGANISM="Durinskia baltica, Strain CSIRO CS-38" /LENGTH=464 /DNA_ID=CAMNT_0010521233 /DNA_START=66 /DNA_END=1457 /DNA_ORIENTATION=+